MSLQTIWCPVAGAHVSRTTNLEGEVIRVICPDYELATGLCRRRTEVLKGGPLAALERTSEQTLADSTMHCLLATS